MRSGVRLLWLVSVASVLSGATLTFDASLGTFPETQGFVYGNDSGNPPPTISSGALQQNSTAGAQYWYTPSDSAIDFSQHLAIQADLHILSSNYIANVGTGTREGYYLGVSDSNSTYIIGLAATGFNINSTGTPNQPLTAYPFTITDSFHLYRIIIANGQAAFFIDGTLISNIPPAPGLAIAGSGAHSAVFGAISGLSRSVTELRSFCYDTSDLACSSAAVPEPASFTLTGTGLIILLILPKLFSMRRFLVRTQ